MSTYRIHLTHRKENKDLVHTVFKDNVPVLVGVGFLAAQKFVADRIAKGDRYQESEYKNAPYCDISFSELQADREKTRLFLGL